jgi:DNA-binding LacI/PurR family transcriptional regulator
MKPKKPTLKQIATQLGLSISTVSRALRGMPEINFETRQAVISLSKNLDYKSPSGTPSGLETENSLVIASFIPCFDAHHVQMLKGMNESALNAGFTLSVIETGGSFGREVAAIQRLLKTKVDGFLISKANETTTADHFQNILKLNKPLVFFDSKCADIQAPQYFIDYSKGAVLGTELLIEKGYRKICFLGAKASHSSVFSAEYGHLKALKEANLSEYEKKIIMGDFDQNHAYEKTTELLKQAERPDAFFAANEEVAIGVFRAVTDLGYNIPKDIGILSYFDAPFLAASAPSISAVSVPSYELGKQAVNALIEEIHLGINSKPKEVIFEPSLEIRESTNHQRRFFGI